MQWSNVQNLFGTSYYTSHYNKSILNLAWVWFIEKFFLLIVFTWFKYLLDIFSSFFIPEYLQNLLNAIYVF